MEQSELLVNLAFALGVAWLGAIIAIALRQTIILGYILGGFVIGPYTPGFVGDPVVVEDLANIGVILLMFAIGVHISIAELARVGRVAVIGGSLQLVIIIATGVLIGAALGWGFLESLFFGAVLAISSGAVMSRLLGERGELGATHGRIALAWSAVQDFGTIVLVVVLTALAEGEGDIAADVGWAVAKAALFLAIMIPVGSRVLPWVFERVAALRSREVFILTVAAIALGTAYVSSLFGLSLALGAFVAGIVVSESDLSHQILGHIEPLRDIFAGLFFVSIGMFVDIAFVVTHLPLLLVTVAAIVVGKGVVIALLTALFQYPLRTAILTGVTLSQAGEFSFLLARLGAELDVVSDDVFSLMLAGSAASIVLTGPLFSLIDPLFRWLQPRVSRIGADAVLAEDETAAPLRAHAVLVGYGRVGEVIATALQRRGFAMIVIDQDKRIVRRLRDEGVTAILGYADQPALLDLAHLETARVLVVAIPDAFATRRIVDYARRVNPRLDIVARTHSYDERQFLADHGVNEAVIGELELALELTRFTLHRFGVGSIETRAIIDGLRHRYALNEEE